MTCNKCNINPCCCTVTVGKPYYYNTETCEEDHSKTTYVNQFSFAVCPENSWNIPLCGQTAILDVPGVVGATLGSFLWHPSYGYYEIISVDADNGKIGIVNNCTPGNATPGVQVTKCTCFIITDNASDALSSCTLFPHVDIDFVAPADGDCIDIQITTGNGIATGDTIAIGSGFYFVEGFVTSNIITICNQGEGIAPGTVIIAKDTFGNCLYPISVTGNCCDTLPGELADLTIIVNNNTTAIEELACAPIEAFGGVPLSFYSETYNPDAEGYYEVLVDGSVMTITVPNDCPDATYLVIAHLSVAKVLNIAASDVTSIYTEIEARWDNDFFPVTKTCGKSVWTIVSLTDGKDIGGFPPSPAESPTFDQLLPAAEDSIMYHQDDIEACAISTAGTILNLELYLKQLTGDNWPVADPLTTGIMVTGWVTAHRISIGI